MRTFLGLLFATSLFAAAHRQRALIISDISVVDVDSGTIEPHRTVVIRGNRIASVTASRAHAAGAISGTGLYLIPGLWDMHVHLWYKYHQFPLYLANGVTGVRDMGSDLARVNQWRAEMRTGKLIGPRVITCGPPIDGPEKVSDPKLPVLIANNPNEAREAFSKLDDKLRVDFIKILSNLDRESYFAIAEQSRHWYIPLAGHVPDSVSVWEAILDRQNSIEHLFGVLLACSSREDELRQRRLAALKASDRSALREIGRAILDSYSSSTATYLFSKLKMFDIRQTPTLVMRKRMAFIDPAGEAEDPNLRYVEKSIRQGWTDPAEDLKGVPPEALDLARAEYDRLLAIVREMSKAGVEILAGTDTGDPYTVPGFELHKELELLVEAGMTSREALRAATTEPARYFRKQDSMGAVRPRYVADLVLLSANPLTDISNTRKIAGVVVNGKYLSPKKLHRMLNDAAARAATE
jgi:hypothetical protein